MRYRKKPVEVEAQQWDGSYESQSRIVTWSEGAVSYEPVEAVAS